MKKRITVYGVPGVLLLGYLGFLVYFSMRDGATKANFHQLEIGMTKSQVQCVLSLFPDERHHWVQGQVHENWLGTDGTIMLAFDEQNTLIWKDWDEHRCRRTLREKWDNIGENVWYFVRE